MRRFVLLLLACLFVSSATFAAEFPLTKLGDLKETVGKSAQVCGDYFILDGTPESGFITAISDDKSGNVMLFILSTPKWIVVVDDSKSVPTVERIGTGDNMQILVRLSSALQKQSAACLPKPGVVPKRPQKPSDPKVRT